MTNFQKLISSWQILIVVCFFLYVKMCNSQGFTVIGSKMLQTNRPYTVTFSNWKDQNTRVLVTLAGKNNNSFSESKTVVVSKSTTKALTFQIGDIPRGEYKLNVRAADSDFTYDTPLIYSPKTMSVFIQTDKPVYKPGDVLRFRVVIVDIDTRPWMENETVSVGLTDAKGNSIRQWPYARIENGIFQSTVQLSSSPLLGIWNLEVKTNDGVFDQQFELREYVLPKFHIKAHAPELLLVKNRKVTVRVDTYYTFGKPLEGEVTVSLYRKLKDRQRLDWKTSHIIGNTIIEFDLKKELELEPDEQLTTVILKVNVTEAFTNQTENIIESIPVYRNPYQMTLIKPFPRFYPGMPYKVQLLVEQHNGEPVTNEKDVELTISYNGDDLETETSVLEKLTKQGFVEIDLSPPVNAEQISVAVKYDSINYRTIDEIDAAQSQSNQYLGVQLNPDYRIRANREVLFDVTCTEAMTHLSYIIVSRGSIYSYGSTRIFNKKRHSLRLKLLPQMSPVATLFVYYTKNDYLIYDSLELKFEAFNNEVQISLDAAKSSDDIAEYVPGQGIYIDVETAKDSFVAFQAIDQSALLLGSNKYDLTMDDVLKDLAQYNGMNAVARDAFEATGLFISSTAEVDSLEEWFQFSFTANIRRKKSKANQQKAVLVRTVFPESWLWTNITMDGKNDYMQVINTVPDTITSWYVTGFALSPTLGLAVIREPVKFVVKQPFYIIANLPYSIKRSEVTVIQVTVFNFLGSPITTEVTLYNKNNEIEFVEQSSNNTSRRSKSILVPADNGKPISFMIKAKKLGEIAVKIEAVNALAADAVEHILRVTPESRMYEKNEARYIELPSSGSQKHDISLNIPREIDEGSAKIQFVLDADVFGVVTENLDALISQPCGCGEQTMLSFIPNIIVLEYLKAAGNIAKNVQETALGFLIQGYQNMLKFQTSDGAFSVFVNHDGSTLLTSLVATSFKLAQKYINGIDNNIITTTFRWLAANQESDGRFKEKGQVYHTELQGGMQNSNFALTAFVLIAFLEHEDISREYRGTVQAGLEYLVNNFNNMNDSYDLSLTTYALSLNGHIMRKAFLDKLVETAKILNDNTNWKETYLYWERDPVEIEVAGYGLLSYITQGYIIDASPIMRWLNTKRYSLGAFHSTQDTFVGLKSLAKYAAKTISDRNDYRVTLSYDPAGRNQIDIDRENSMVTQTLDLPDNIRRLTVKVEGTGVGWLQIKYRYYLNLQQSAPSFKLDVEVLNTTTYHVQHLQVCVSYIQKEAYQRSNMALVEVFFPSGLVADVDAVRDLSIPNQIRLVELTSAGNSVVVYYDNLGEETNCFEVTSYRRYKVAMHRPAYVVVYDYDVQDRFAIKTYEGKVMQLCDICEDEDCAALAC